MTFCKICGNSDYGDIGDFVCDDCKKRFLTAFQIEKSNFIQFPSSDEIRFLLNIYKKTGSRIFSIDNRKKCSKTIYEIMMGSLYSSYQELIISIYPNCKNPRIGGISFYSLVNDVLEGSCIRGTSKKEIGRLYRSNILDFKNSIAKDFNSKGVYFIKNCDFIKIGMSNNSIKRRISSQLSTPGNELLCWYNSDNPAKEEKRLHNKFAEYRIKSKSEWFRYEGGIKSFSNAIINKFNFVNGAANG